MKNTIIRFYEKNEADMRAWNILHQIDVMGCRSQSALVVKALNYYYDRQLRLMDDPYLETREKEDRFIDRIVSAVEKKVFETLPTMVGMAFMQQMAGIQNQQGGMFNHETPYGSETDEKEDSQQAKNGDDDSESLHIEENEFLDFDFCG